MMWFLYSLQLALLNFLVSNLPYFFEKIGYDLSMIRTLIS